MKTAALSRRLSLQRLLAQDAFKQREHDEEEKDCRYRHGDRLQVRARHTVITEREEDPENDRREQ